MQAPVSFAGATHLVSSPRHSARGLVASRPRRHRLWPAMELPCGTVTMVFTDIEGSTRPPASARRRALRAGARGSPAPAARGLRREQAASRWRCRATRSTSPSRMRARRCGPRPRRNARSPRTRGRASRSACGSGSTPATRSSGAPLYAGLDVHRAARVMSAGHGGQVLLSEATCALVRASLADELAAPRPRRAPAEGPVRAAAPLPARRGASSRRSGRSTRRTCRCPRRRSSAASASSRSVSALLADDGVGC